jgi:integrase
MKLTASAIKNHKPLAKPDYILFDEDVPGFGLRIRGPARTWIFQYPIGTPPHRITRRYKIGNLAAMEPAKARKVAEDLHAKVHLGEDPAAQKRQNRSEASDTFGKLVEAYLAFKETELRGGSYDQVRRHLQTNVKSLHALPLSSIDQRTVADRLNAVARASGAVTANRTRASLSAMFAWAMGEGRAVANPVANTNKREEKSRERVLTDDELRTVWLAAEDDHHGTIVKLLMMTGQRRGEIGGLRWSEIDLDRNLILLPGARTKNGQPHEVPITGTVRDIIKSQAKNDGRDLIFGFGDGPFSGWSRSKEALDKAIENSAGKAPSRWTLHDVRRSVATRMADIGIPPHVIEAVLNHVSGHKGGVAGIYNRALYTAEKAQALARWEEHVSALVSGRPSSITPLKRA